MDRRPIEKRNQIVSLMVEGMSLRAISQVEDHKTLNTQVDKARDAQQSKLLRLKAELAFQDSQRKQGIFRPDTPPIVPSAGAARYGQRLSKPATAPD